MTSSRQGPFRAMIFLRLPLQVRKRRIPAIPLFVLPTHHQNEPHPPVAQMLKNKNKVLSDTQEGRHFLPGSCWCSAGNEGFL